MRSNAIQFYSSNNTEVLRLSKDGITANPEIPVDEAAKLVLAAIESNIKLLVQKAVEEEREANRQIALRKMRMLKDTERAHYKQTTSLRSQKAARWTLVPSAAFSFGIR